jgi:hypothetical protein
VELYEPINTLKPVGEDLWVVDGPVVRMAYLEPDEGLRSRIDALGPVRHLVSPNKLHYAHAAAWKRAYPG